MNQFLGASAARVQHHLARAGAAILPLREFELCHWRRGPALSIVCDDGCASDLREVVPLLDRMGLPGCFAPVSGLVGLDGHMKATELRALARSGHEIASHSDVHRPLTARAPGELKIGLARARDALSEIVQQPVTTLVYPYGNNGRLVRSLASASYDCGITTWTGMQHGSFNRFAIRRVPFGSYCRPGQDTWTWFERLLLQATSQGSWLLLMLHTAAPAHDLKQSMLLERLLRFAVESGVPVVTVRDALSTATGSPDTSDQGTAR
jgi:peptidoglycan/xylan/chitin deacetylase (PgdA/CDA1 family)